MSETQEKRDFDRAVRIAEAKIRKGSEIVKIAEEMDDEHARQYNDGLRYPITISYANHRCECFEELLKDKVVVLEAQWLQTEKDLQLLNDISYSATIENQKLHCKVERIKTLMENFPIYKSIYQVWKKQLPHSPDELHLTVLSQLDSARMEWFEKLRKAIK